MMHGYLAYPPQAYPHQGNPAPAPTHSPYVQHMTAGAMITAAAAAAQPQLSTPPPQMQQLKENGFYKRYSDVKTLARPTDSVPEPKKARYDMNSTTATKVVSLRNIPNDISDLQIVFMGLEFGDVVNILYIKGKGQALIEFQNLNEAIEMVQYFRSINDNSLLKSVEAAHSSYHQLTIDNNRATSTANTINLGKQLKESSKNGGDGCVIKAIITNIQYPIYLDALYQIFSKYGNVLKIVLTQKNEFGALIQMKEDIQVQQAIHNLNNRNMYNSFTGPCNILNLQISQYKTIDVKYNNSKSWDYTNPLLLMIEKNDGGAKNSMIPEHALLPMPLNPNGAPSLTNQAAAVAAANGAMTLATASNQIPFNAAAASNATGYPIQTLDNRSTVVQVSNFPEQISTPDALFTLFGVYGDILKVKIMYNRRDNALMQFKTYEQALTAVSKMDKVKLWNKAMQVGLSKFPEIQIPIKNDGGLAKDYSTSPLHRFKKPGSKNFYNIFQPNSTLHLSNISPTTTQDNLQELFSKHGAIHNFKWINKEGNKMALLEMSSVEEAVLALIALHNYQLNGSYLRVNFAK